ncbi:MAG: 16S rRNA (cytidine(1402)-2'-O)-methyltransferase [Actinobacteria bacterium]|nr:16S rRNA (cytidine(1402)-2'-O)-methyltransferase [Actinomycetota bacterium]
MTPGLTVVATPIGNLADLSERAADALRRADVVACEDTRRTATLLRAAKATTPMLATHEHNEAARAAEIVARILEGANVALVSDAGLPSVSDPGRRVVAAVRAAGLPVSVIPGPSAVLTALVASGFAAETVCFVGFFPRRASEVGALLDRIDPIGATVVGFESPHRAAALLATLAPREPTRAVAVCRELTKRHEEVTVGSVADIAASIGAPKGEITIVLAPATRPPEPDDAIERAVRAALAAGLSPARAADLVAEIRGGGRNAAYRAAISAASRAAIEAPSSENPGGPSATARSRRRASP